MTSGGRRPVKAKDIAPGVWTDLEGNVHFDTAAMCEAAGVPPTPENQEILAEEIRKARDREWPETPIVDDWKP